MFSELLSMEEVEAIEQLLNAAESEVRGGQQKPSPRPRPKQVQSEVEALDLMISEK